MKSINLKKYISFNLKKYINFNSYKYKRYKLVSLYVIGFILITPIIYLSIPIFFDYEKSKNSIESKIYSDFGLSASIEGKIRYNLLPSPQIKIKKLLINDLIDKKKNLGEVEYVILKIPFKKLASLNKINFNKLELVNVKINLDMNKLNKYKKYFSEEFNSKNIQALGGYIQLLDGKKPIAKINNVDLEYNSNSSIDETILKGDFIGDSIVIKYKNKKKINSSSIISVKFKNLRFRANAILSMPDEENISKGKASFSFGRHKGNFTFDLKEDLVKISKGNIRNEFFNGKIFGDIKFLPFFNFNINLDLANLNFRSIAKRLSEMDSQTVHDLFVLNDKIYGNLNLNVDKIYSSSKLVKSLESRIQFNNKDIILDQMLIDLGKLGAADIIGRFTNKKNNINFIFRKNLFIDNAKYFYSRFGIYNKSSEPENLFISGTINLKKPKIRLDEIVSANKLDNESMNFFEDEFNQIILENQYKTFIDFYTWRKFIKSITSEIN